MTVCYWCGAKDTLADIGKELEDGKYKMVQCRKCKNAYYVVNKEKMNKPKPMTNEEYLKSLNTEQLAKWIYQLSVMDRIDQPWYFTPIRGSQKIVEWLKQPHRDGES